MLTGENPLLLLPANFQASTLKYSRGITAGDLEPGGSEILKEEEDDAEHRIRKQNNCFDSWLARALRIQIGMTENGYVFSGSRFGRKYSEQKGWAWEMIGSFYFCFQEIGFHCFRHFLLLRVGPACPILVSESIGSSLLMEYGPACPVLVSESVGSFL